MTDITLDPDLAALAPATPPPLVSPAELRRRVTEGNALCAAGPALSDVADTSIAGVPVRVYRANPGRTLVWLHGGGWVTGDLDYSDELCRFLARDARCTVVSVDYRLAPEHPHPAALDDARAVLAGVAADCAGPLAIGGDSAGGNLAAGCATPSLAFQVLVYPVLDHDFTRPSYLRATDGIPLGATAMRWFWDQYVPDVSRRDRPDVAPLRAADLAGLPATHVVVAGQDPLYDEGIAYARALRAAGVEVTVTEHLALGHGFFRFTGAVPAARAAVAELTGTVAKLFDAATKAG